MVACIYVGKATSSEIFLIFFYKTLFSVNALMNTSILFLYACKFFANDIFAV